MPTVSEAQRKAMQAAKAGNSTIGIPQSVGQEFTAADVEGGQTSPGSIRETLSPLVQDPVEAFLVALLGVADEIGVLDEAFQDSTLEDELDEQAPTEGSGEFLSEQQITEIISLFMAIPEPKRSQIEQQMREVLPSHVMKRWDAAIRFTRQRGAGQGGESVTPA